MTSARAEAEAIRVKRELLQVATDCTEEQAIAVTFWCIDTAVRCPATAGELLDLVFDICAALRCQPAAPGVPILASVARTAFELKGDDIATLVSLGISKREIVQIIRARRDA